MRLVSSRPVHSIMIDQFFERVFLPSFNQAQGLRVAALFESVAAVLSTTLDQVKSGRHDLPTGVRYLEEKLCLAKGGVSEQLTTLQQAFLELGGAPEPVLSSAENIAPVWMHTNSTARIPSWQVSEWLQTAVQESVERCMEDVRGVCRRAIYRDSSKGGTGDRAIRPTCRG